MRHAIVILLALSLCAPAEARTHHARVHHKHPVRHAMAVTAEDTGKTVLFIVLLPIELFAWASGGGA